MGRSAAKYAPEVGCPVTLAFLSRLIKGTAERSEIMQSYLGR